MCRRLELHSDGGDRSSSSVRRLIAVTLRNEENTVGRVQFVAEMMPGRFSIRGATPELTELSILLDSNTEEDIAHFTALLIVMKCTSWGPNKAV
jgi:hypothetical protein